jgi:hypothetical protein
MVADHDGGIRRTSKCSHNRGIVAALYRFRREKPHKARLQPTISGVAATKGGIIHLQVGVSAENVGQVPIALDKEATTLRVSSRRTGDSGWSRPPVLTNVLGQQDQIQPGETLIDQEWFEVPDNNEVAFKLELSLDVCCQDQAHNSLI